MCWCPADGNGFEVGGVDQEVMDAFSSRRAQITPEVERMAEEYRQRYGREPSQRTLWAMAQEVTLATRKANRKTDGADAGQSRPRSPGRSWTAGKPAPPSGKSTLCRGCTKQWPGSLGPRGWRLRRSWAPAPGRGLSGWRWPRRRNARRPGPGRRCYGELHRAMPAMAPGVDQTALLEQLAD